MKRILIILLFAVACTTHAQDGRWMILTGYGETHTDWGGTKQHVETMDVILRHSTRFKDTGRDWFKGSHNLFVELPIHFVTNPDTSPIFAMNFISCWILETHSKTQPYMFIGGGPVYTEAGIAGMGSKINGNYQAGFGLYLRAFNDQLVTLEWRYHHISNASTASPNDPLNSSKYLIGMNLPF